MCGALCSNRAAIRSHTSLSSPLEIQPITWKGGMKSSHHTKKIPSLVGDSFQFQGFKHLKVLTVIQSTVTITMIRINFGQDPTLGK